MLLTKYLYPSRKTKKNKKNKKNALHINKITIINISSKQITI
jgi:hypothetical protein